MRSQRNNFSLISAHALLRICRRFRAKYLFIWSCSHLNISPLKLLTSDNKKKQRIQGLFEGLCFNFHARFRGKCSLPENFKIILLAFPAQKKYFKVWQEYSFQDDVNLRLPAVKFSLTRPNSRLGNLFLQIRKFHDIFTLQLFVYN